MLKFLDILSNRKIYFFMFLLHGIFLHAASSSQSQSKDITLSLNLKQKVVLAESIWRQSTTLSNLIQDTSSIQEIPIDFDRDVVQFLKNLLEKTARNSHDAFNNHHIRDLVRSRALRSCTKEFLYRVIDLADFLDIKGHVAYAIAISGLNKGLVNKDDFVPNATFIFNEKLINKSKMLINAGHLFAEVKGCYADRYQAPRLDSCLGFILDMCERYFFKIRDDAYDQSASALTNYPISIYDYKKRKKLPKITINMHSVHLNLSNRALTSLTGVTLVENVNLVTHANLNNNHLSDEGLKFLADAVTHNENSLIQLSLDNNKLRSTEYIPKNLQRVSAKGNYLSPNQVQELIDTCDGKVEAGGQRSFSYKAYRVVQFALNVSAISAFIYAGTKLIK